MEFGRFHNSGESVDQGFVTSIRILNTSVDLSIQAE
jgi:hypothetical protein